MATFGIKVFRHHEKKDGTFNVKIRVTMHRKTAYIDTIYYVTANHLTKDYRIKDTLVLKQLYTTIEEYRESINRLGQKIVYMNANDLKAFLEKKTEQVDFLEFCQQHIDKLVKEGRLKTAANLRTVWYSLADFVAGRQLNGDDITPHFLMAYERYLRQPRKITRPDRSGKLVTTTSKGMSVAGVHNYMRDFKGLFTAAQSYYNKPSLGIILLPFHPFQEYKLSELPETRKRSLTIEQVKAIIAYQPEHGGRVELARDLFILSFYLCGMNAVDLYTCGFVINNERLEYERSKTKGKRKDRAFISIKIPERAFPLIEKYRDRLSREYAEIGNLNKALNKGLKVVGDAIGVPGLSFYWARHTFGNLARNKCRKSKDDVALALNHVDQARKTTDIYLEKDWSIVDEVQEAVLSLIVELNYRHVFEPVRQILCGVSLPQLIKTQVAVTASSSTPRKLGNASVSYNPDEQRKAMCVVKG